MQKRLREARDNRDAGFTLIELLIVIVVLGILATIVVFGVATFRADASDEACRANVKTAQVAYDAYKVKSPTGNPTIDDLKTAGYLKTVPSQTITFTNGVAAANPACPVP
jgi:prepilin-type N-terminal cleavage/methylation domain-containing protein